MAHTVLLDKLCCHDHYVDLMTLLTLAEGGQGFDSTERLALGHLREVECSLFHVGRTTWLEGNMPGAVTLLEALFKSPERHVRNMPEVRALLAMAHLSGGYSDRPQDLMDLRIGLVANLVEETNMRPLLLEGSRFTCSDVLRREGAMVPDTVLPVWRSIALALSLNSILQDLDLSDCDMGSAGFADLVAGLMNNTAIHTLLLANNQLGVKSGAKFLTATSQAER